MLCVRNRQHFYPSEKFKIGHQFTPSDIGKSLATVQSYAQDSNCLQVYFGSGGKKKKKRGRCNDDDTSKFNSKLTIWMKNKYKI